MSDDERRDELATVLFQAVEAWAQLSNDSPGPYEAAADAALAWFAATLADADDRLEAATNRMAAAERRLTRVDEVAAERDVLAAQLEAARRAHAELVEVATDLRTDLLDKLEKAQGQSTYASAAAREALWVLDELDLSGCVPRSWSA